MFKESSSLSLPRMNKDHKLFNIIKLGMYAFETNVEQNVILQRGLHQCIIFQASMTAQRLQRL